jgi:pimeloyl-ACP methyl ester carboxylesterase
VRRDTAAEPVYESVMYSRPPSAPDVLTAEVVVTADVGVAGPTFLLVHGIGVSSRYFERLVPVLAERGRVVAVDLPGFGRAPKPGFGMSVEDFAALLAASLDRLGLVRFTVVGHSMGTQIATRLALIRPDAVQAVALLGPVTDPRDRNGLTAALMLAKDCLGESPRGNWVVFTDYLRCGIRWYLTVLPSMLTYPIEEELTRLSTPVLVMRGKADPIARRSWVRALANRAPGSRIAEVADARHLVMHARPRETAALLHELAEAAP